jgi:uncharacterized membrane protein
VTAGDHRVESLADAVVIGMRPGAEAQARPDPQDALGPVDHRAHLRAAGHLGQGGPDPVQHVRHRLPDSPADLRQRVGKLGLPVITHPCIVSRASGAGQVAFTGDRRSRISLARDDHLMSSAEQAAAERATERLIFFSDAVVAIAITLLAIDLPVPSGSSMPQFWASVRDNDSRYVSFLISFMVIAAVWGRHHDVFRYASRLDPRLRTLNMCWLLTIILNPFATRMLTARSADTMALRFGFYALLQALASGVMLVMVHHMISRDLLVPDAPRLAGADADWQSYGLMLGFGLSIPLFFATSAAWILWFAGPLAAHQLRRRKRRHGQRDDQ